jgi:hypothetical protein
MTHGDCLVEAKIKEEKMYEIIMLFAFFYAATCQLLPRTNQGDQPNVLRKKRSEGRARERTKSSAPKQKTCQKKPVRCSNRKPVLHVQQSRLDKRLTRALAAALTASQIY